MCVILDKNAGSEIPFDKILSAAIRNDDGYGIIVIDREKIEVIKGLTTKPGVTADLIAKRMEDAKDQRVLCHLRLKTHGLIDEKNLHPFSVLGHDDMGTELYMMHNGVLSDFSSHDRTAELSDTAIFVDDVARPLCLALAKLHGPDELLDNLLFKRIMSKYAGTSNRLSFIDGKGKVTHINYAQGRAFPWGWASNEYSFGHSGSAKDWEDAGRTKPVPVRGFLPGPSTTTTSTTPTGINHNAEKIVAASGNPINCISDYAPANRVDICTVLDIDDLSGLHCLDEHDWFKIVKQEPEVAVLALLDLTYFHYRTMVEEHDRLIKGESA